MADQYLLPYALSPSFDKTSLVSSRLVVVVAHRPVLLSIFIFCEACLWPAIHLLPHCTPYLEKSRLAYLQHLLPRYSISPAESSSATYSVPLPLYLVLRQ